MSENCVYNQEDPSTTFCGGCGDGLCDTCGFMYNGSQYCNRCYEEIRLKNKGNNNEITS